MINWYNFIYYLSKNDRVVYEYAGGFDGTDIAIIGTLLQIIAL